MATAKKTMPKSKTPNIVKIIPSIRINVFIFPKGFKLFPAKILPFSFPCNYFPRLSIIPTNWSPTNRA